ncbi:MAG: signal peptidase II [Bacillota bacterium]
MNKRKGVKNSTRNLIFWLIVSGGIILDQVSKFLVKTNMGYLESLPVIPGIFHLTYIINQGAAWSILTGYRWFFVIIGIAVLIGILIFRHLFVKKDLVLDIGLAFLVAGATGNLIDRFLFGGVIDFFDLTIINFAIFNVADCFIVLAVIIIIYHLLIFPLIQQEKEKNRCKQATSDD